MVNYYSYTEDKVLANTCEKIVAGKISSRFKCRVIKFNNDNKYDILFQTSNSSLLKVEVKQDFTCARTGNVGLEYECRGKASGIQTSESDLYCYCIHHPNGDIKYYLIKTKDLKNMITNKLYCRLVIGGDEGSNSKNFLFKLDVFLNYCIEV